MGHYTRQHYLPCAYLQNFSVDADQANRSSKVWRLDSKHVAPVSVDEQCFGNYLFSKADPSAAEAEFGVVEGGFAKAVKKIRSGGRPTPEEYLSLIYATFEFHVRNLVHENDTGGEGMDAYHDRMTTMLNRLIVAHDSSEALSPEEMLCEILKTWAVRLIRSLGPLLVTSDNPSLCFAWEVGRKASFFILPVTPQICAVVFDKRSTEICGDTLTESDGRGFIDALARHCNRCVYTTNKPNDTLTKFCRSIWDTRIKVRSVTGETQWCTNLIRPSQSDVFSFIRPIE